MQGDPSRWAGQVQPVRLRRSTGSLPNLYCFGATYGAYTDPIGLLKIGQHYYNPSIGRSAQQDPVLHLSDPKQWNRYIYAGCNPVNLIDPGGLSPCSMVFGDASAVLGVIAIGLAITGFGAVGDAAIAYLYFGTLIGEASLLAGVAGTHGCPP